MKLETNKLMMIDLEDYNFMKNEIERLKEENKRLKEEVDSARSEAFQLQREMWRVRN
jgi:FtsZ-binding cell division protein ZapB